MIDNDINTGNIYADSALRQKIVDDLLGWAIVEYLERKGLLNRAEFWDILNEVCRRHVYVTVRCEIEDRAEQG